MIKDKNIFGFDSILCLLNEYYIFCFQSIETLLLESFSYFDCTRGRKSIFCICYILITSKIFLNHTFFLEFSQTIKRKFVINLGLLVKITLEILIFECTNEFSQKIVFI